MKKQVVPYLDKVLKIADIFQASAPLEQVQQHALRVICEVLDVQKAELLRAPFTHIPTAQRVYDQGQTLEADGKVYSLVRANGNKLGVLEVSDKHGGSFTEEDLRLSSLLAVLMGQAMKITLQVELIKEMNDEVFDLVTAMIDAKDEYTAGHSKRVGYYAAKIGEVLEMSENEISKLRLGGVLHDIGKMGIHDSILKKPARLTPEEYEEIMRHPDISAQMLSNYKYFQDVIHITRDHHLRPDEMGYPRKPGTGRQYKKWEDVDMLTRVVTVADAFDAMWGGRNYQARMSLPDIVKEFRKLSDIQFDKTVAEALITYLERRYGKDALAEKPARKKAA